jgi:DNA-binding NarL/FixJ family response regulator
LWLDAVSGLAADAGIGVVGTTTKPAEAVELLEEHHPDLFVLGLEYDAAGSGRAVARTLLAAAAAIGGVVTVVVSGDTDAGFVEECFLLGASAYALKTIGAADLSSILRQEIDRCVYLFNGPSRARRSDPPAPEKSEIARLTRREIDVLRVVAEGLSNAEVARALWISEPTVKFHLSRIYEKLGVSNRTGAAHWAARHDFLRGERLFGADLRPAG